MSNNSPKGLNASMWAPSSSEQAPTEPRTWTRGKEPESTFRGAPRGRGRGRGGGPTWRGRGAAPALGRRGDAVLSSSKNSTVQSTSRDLPSSQRAKAPAALDLSKSGQATSESQSKPNFPAGKASSRRPSRKVPALNIEPSSPVTNAPVSPTRSTGRRRRSKQASGNTSSTILIRTPSSEAESVSAPSLMQSPIALKGATPHMTTIARSVPGSPALDKRQDIESLVEHVRALAMENNRPTTPGSHIDWAGDDDDSLPDLDDWGVKANDKVGIPEANGGGIDDLTPKAEQPVPMLSENKIEKAEVKIQPSVSAHHTTTLEPVSPLSPAMKGREGERNRGRGRNAGKEKASNGSAREAVKLSLPSSTKVSPGSASQKATIHAQARAPQPLLSNARRDDVPHLHRPPKSASLGPGSAASSKTEFSDVLDRPGIEPPRSPSKLPYHPSLPPKPMTSLYQSAVTPEKGNSAATANPTAVESSWRNSSNPNGTAVQIGQSSSSEADENNTSINTISISPPPPAVIKSASTEDLHDEQLSTPSIQADQLDESVGMAEKETVDSKSQTPEVEEPPLITVSHSQSSSDLRRTHNRSHTVADPSRVPPSMPIPRKPRDRFPFQHHDRTQSLPQGGPGTPGRSRTPHATRPIISIDAIHRISKSLGADARVPAKREAPLTGQTGQ
ncbi:hypothetical protein BD410DRAFT_779868 [Rickenella mellea]|uniref:Uncharacterized protein n=1 Tax=Rickenella mellea TaxID=50990 RepID=A0A4R5XGF6_9AGAM|nr:hypothetical protein BD410DRAFT_779868 [Rickenella mellea]